jgi:hypothetical protein
MSPVAIERLGGSVSLVGAINQADWHEIGLNQTIVPPSEFHDYEFTFVPHGVVPVATGFEPHKRYISNSLRWT